MAREIGYRQLALRLEVELGRRDGPDAAREARRLEAAWPDPPGRAEILDAAARLDPAQHDAWQAAAARYRELYERGPTVRYRQAYERLTGATLPPAPPLPPLPAAAIDRRPDVADLLSRAESAWRRGGAGPPSGPRTSGAGPSPGAMARA